MVNVLERENQTFDHIYDWTTNLNIKQRKKGENTKKSRNCRNKTFNTDGFSFNNSVCIDYDSGIR